MTEPAPPTPDSSAHARLRDAGAEIPAAAAPPQGSMRRIRMSVQYDGAAFHGWQYQVGQPSVQEALETALARLLGRTVRVFGAGRTDAGVHALAMPLHFETDHPIPADRLPMALREFLPPALSVLESREVAPDFDARRSALLRWYRYQVLLAPHRRPLGPRAWQVYRALNFGNIEEGLALVCGRHDFQGFRSSQCQSARTVLTMEQASMRHEGDLLAFDFKCRSFLHHMIRFLVGTLIVMGDGSLGRERLLRILEQGERPQLIQCAPPHGLCLMGVAYNDAECRGLLAADPPLPSF